MAAMSRCILPIPPCTAQGGIEKDERGLEGSDAEPKDAAAPKPKKRKKPAAADKPGSEADGVQVTDGAAAVKPKASGKKAAAGVQGGEGSGADGAAKPKVSRKRKAADEGDGPAKKPTKQVNMHQVTGVTARNDLLVCVAGAA